MIIVVLGVVAWIVFAAWRGRVRRWKALVDRFGETAALRIRRKQVWQGETPEMLLESFGKPLEIREHVLKASTKHTYCYNRVAKNRYALRVHLQDGIVVGWDC